MKLDNSIRFISGRQSARPTFSTDYFSTNGHNAYPSAANPPTHPVAVFHNLRTLKYFSQCPRLRPGAHGLIQSHRPRLAVGKTNADAPPACGAVSESITVASAKSILNIARLRIGSGIAYCEFSFPSFFLPLARCARRVFSMAD